MLGLYAICLSWLENINQASYSLTKLILFARLEVKTNPSLQDVSRLNSSFRCKVRHIASTRVQFCWSCHYKCMLQCLCLLISMCIVTVKSYVLLTLPCLLNLFVIQLCENGCLRFSRVTSYVFAYTTLITWYIYHTYEYVYTMGHKKCVTLFSIIIIVFLNQF